MAISMYARMRGRALAGARGNVEAGFSFSRWLPSWCRLPGVSHFGRDLPETLHERAVQVSLDGSKLVLAPWRYRAAAKNFSTVATGGHDVAAWRMWP